MIMPPSCSPVEYRYNPDIHSRFSQTVLEIAGFETHSDYIMIQTIADDIYDNLRATRPRLTNSNILLDAVGKNTEVEG